MTHVNQVRLTNFQIDIKSFLNTGLTWVQPENFHLTLGFLGELDQKSIDKLIYELELELSKFNQTACTFTGLGTFPHFRQPRVVWIGVRSTPGLGKLTSAVQNTSHKCGIKIKADSTTPHVTLARIKQNLNPTEILAIGMNIRQIKPPDLTDQVLDRIILFRSELRSIGPLYTNLHEFLIPPT